MRITSAFQYRSVLYLRPPFATLALVESVGGGGGGGLYAGHYGISSTV